MTQGPQRVRRRRRVRAASVGVAVLVVVGVGTAVVLARPRPSTATPSAPAPPATAEVTRADLAEQQSADGTLGYGEERDLTSAARGTITWLPASGAVITRGKQVLGVDARPVVLFYGTTPLYRDLAAGMTDGPDVKVVEQNLAALGFDDFGTPDEEFTSNTAAAIEDWQDSLGLDETGKLSRDAVVVQPGAVRVSSVSAELGGQPGAQLMKVTGTQRAVTVDLPLDEQSYAKKGAKVGLEITGGASTTGTVADVGAVTQPENPQDDATVPVTIALHDQKAAGSLDSAPVTVTFTTGHREHVLTVPVGALLALAEGGFAVDVVDGPSRHHLVAVQTGLFAQGLVEVTGDLHEGQKVVTTS
ncbi:peptidoglycan-binding protein [Labedaea rhizosphaerae]|uniref:Multidrug efflux pump subunit AcrA (Membrane-fusion protein) n=1 Tax=Labedaea rhizosphaerae TaxID=598644 RepID=A0A4R6SEF4_LABRH|nr:peptidoglycan-binding protein [Labedaea rhizosphaerae]TDP97515.1 multidrug efflux pump subunit AcrA (membrane-fusion protein) [Labedaea rhizosphaerae]